VIGLLPGHYQTGGNAEFGELRFRLKYQLAAMGEKKNVLILAERNAGVPPRHAGGCRRGCPDPSFSSSSSWASSSQALFTAAIRSARSKS
jgi:hypothetical protein